MNRFGYFRQVDMSVDSALARLPQLLERDGFIIVSSVDFAQLLQDHLNIEYQRYHVLGVANPPQINNVLDIEKSAGLMFPTNIAVFQKYDGTTVVGMVRVTKLMKITEIDELREVAKFLETKLRYVIDEL